MKQTDETYTGSISEFKIESYFAQDINEKVEFKYFPGLEILEIYPGSKYEDTCISEITNE